MLILKVLSSAFTQFDSLDYICNYSVLCYQVHASSTLDLNTNLCGGKET